MKSIFKKRLVYIDLEKDKDKVDIRYYNIEVLSVGYNKMQVISSSGKGDNKGRESIIRIEHDKNPFEEAIKVAWQKYHEKKAMGYIRREKLVEALTDIKKPDHKSLNRKKYNKKGSKAEKTYKCDGCNRKIQRELYEKINAYARGNGGWDQNKKFVGYKKVFCIKCQIEKDLFQNSVEK